MTIVVHQVDGQWRRAMGVLELTRMATTCMVTFADGRQEEQACAPYPVVDRLDLTKVAALVQQRVWGNDELAVYQLREPILFVAPEGKQAIGEERFEEDGDEVRQIYEVEDIPPPPPPPPPPTIDDWLASGGFSIDDLKARLGLDG